MRAFLLTLTATILAAAACTTAPKTTPDVAVRVEGDPGLVFAGSIGSGGNSRSVQAQTPFTFVLPGETSGGIFVAVLQNKAASGRLVVTLECKGGDKSGETSAPYGVVTVTC